MTTKPSLRQQECRRRPDAPIDLASDDPTLALSPQNANLRGADLPRQRFPVGVAVVLGVGCLVACAVVAGLAQLTGKVGP